MCRICTWWGYAHGSELHVRCYGHFSFKMRRKAHAKDVHVLSAIHNEKKAFASELAMPFFLMNHLR